MSIWGKIIGGAAGFALGGPIGALVGALAGHTVDVYAKRSAPAEPDRQAAFSVALVALSAKMAKADGVVSRNEILAFREKVHVQKEDLEAVAKLWELARQTTDGYEAYAQQLARLFPGTPAVLEELMGLLFHIAKADGKIDPAEFEYLGRVAGILGFDGDGFERMAAIHGDEVTSPYRVLGADPDWDDAELRKAWLRLVERHHPDRLVGEGLPEEFVQAANDRLAKINAAYETIMAQRKAR